jgi:hypothetical protein
MNSMNTDFRANNFQFKNEDGSVLVIALVIMVLLTLMGMAATTTSTIEVQIAANENYHRLAFYSAEAALAYVIKTKALYYDDNITVGDPAYFPNDADSSAKQTLGSTQKFNGGVQYQGSSVPPAGSGFEVGGTTEYKAHRYVATSTGYGPAGAQSQVEAGFYRIGF